MSRAGARLRGRATRTRRALRNAALQLPLESEDLPGFIRRVGLMIRTPGSFIYIDTSFLMWLIRIGPASRGEFFAWLADAARDRVTIPTWSLHELYRHHSNGRITTDLAKQIKKLDDVVAESFPIFWTIFDEPLNGAASVDFQRNEARDTLRTVRTITERATSWAALYERNAREVIEFANAHAMRGGRLFDELAAIEGKAEARFTGRIPPGFQDKHKKQVVGEEGAAEGSNRWGDLIFWQEILDHAAAHRVRNAIVLTNDVKNDWRMAGSLPVRIGAEPSAPGVQPTHPMLSFEAARTAGIKEVVLLDQRLVSDIMNRSLGDAAGFGDAARPPSLPPPKTESELRKEAREREESTRARVAEGIARGSAYRFADPAELSVSRAILGRALYATREDSKKPSALAALEERFNTSLEQCDILEFLGSDVASSLGAQGLVGFARNLLVGAASDPFRRAAASDLASALETFPPATASCLFMGLLAGSYLDGRNRLLAVPRAAVAERLFAMQQLPFAALPIAEISQRAAKGGRLPLYLPSVEGEPIIVEIKIDSELDRENALRAIWVENHNLLIDIQSDPALRIQDRIKGATLSVERLLEHIAELYVLPRRQLAATGTLLDSYSYDEYMGFREPESVWRESAEEKGQ